MTATMHYSRPAKSAKKPMLKESVEKVLDEYFASLEGEKPEFVYNLVLTEVESPLIEAALKFTDNNQSKAAAMLGLNRGTFRKKMALYGLL